MAGLEPTGTPALFVRRRGTRAYTPVAELSVDAVDAAVAKAARRTR